MPTGPLQCRLRLRLWPGEAVVAAGAEPVQTLVVPKGELTYVGSIPWPQEPQPEAPKEKILTSAPLKLPSRPALRECDCGCDLAGGARWWS